jgi:C-terminal processing protease CtpA/Prc
MLDLIKDDIKKNYYDPNFAGIDIDARFKKADDDLKAATSLRELVSTIAQTLLDFHDSHTFFVPPARSYQTEYGWRMQMIGDQAYIVAVKPGSDAEAKAIKEGDLVLSVNGYKPTRDSLWILQYFYNLLSPQPVMRVALQSPDGKTRELNVRAQVEPGSGLVLGSNVFRIIREAENAAHANRHRYHEIDKEIFIWNMPWFDMSDEEVDQMMARVKKNKALILDLRGNGGGYETTLQRLIGHLFDHDIKIGNVKTRKDSKPMLAKTRGPHNFKGQLVVLIDSRSGSASEVFARVVQLERRGMVGGDRSAGAVMRSRFFEHKHGHEIVVFYGASITDADLVMTDGGRLETNGVVPDASILPTSADLIAKRDPALAHAASLVGLNLDPTKAGTLFPLEWKK